MSEYEPDDSRTVTNSQSRAPGEPPRTGPREDEARSQAGQQTSEQRKDQAGGERAIEGDAEGHPDRMGAFTGEGQAPGAESEETSEDARQSGSWRDTSE
jgi:hypothetical protein